MTGKRLEARGVTRRFGGLTAVEDMSIAAEPAQVTALIGPNGAGKTTLFHCLTGVERPDSGAVLLDGRDITDRSPDARARLGIGRTFQRLAVFPSMTVAENLRVGAESRRPGSLWRGFLGVPDRGRGDDDGRVGETLRRLGLWGVRGEVTGTLSTGTLRLVELGRALCHEPAVLLLDEPASGLDTQETSDLQRVLRDVAATGVAVLLVEHDVELVFHVADTVYAMAEGRLLAAGPPDAVRDDAAVQAAYLDTGAAR